MVTRPRALVWSPLRHVRYRRLWLANLLTNLGTGTQAFATAWLIATVSNSASTTAMVQTVTYAPLLVFALLAGVVADAVDRPKFLFFANLAMAIAAGACAMTVLVLPPGATLVPVLLLTFLLGAGMAFRWPAWQASISTLVEQHELEAVAILENLSYSAGAVAGPVLGGVLFAWLGPAAPFMANTLSFAVVLVLYWRWWHDAGPSSGATAGLWPSFKRGLGIALGSSHYCRLLAQAGAIYFVLIAFSALLPIYVKNVVRSGSNGFGALSACLGLGAALAAFFLPAVRARFEKTHVFVASMTIYGMMLILLTRSASPLVLAALIVVGGMAWCAIISTMLAAAQALFAPEVRARTLSMYLLVMATGYTLGSRCWGVLAEMLGVVAALQLAGAGLILNAVLIFAAGVGREPKTGRLLPDDA